MSHPSPPLLVLLPWKVFGRGAVEGRLGADVDYAMLHKLYDAPDGHDNERCYSLAGLHRRGHAGNHK